MEGSREYKDKVVATLTKSNPLVEYVIPNDYVEVYSVTQKGFKVLTGKIIRMVYLGNISPYRQSIIISVIDDNGREIAKDKFKVVGWKEIRLIEKVLAAGDVEVCEYTFMIVK